VEAWLVEAVYGVNGDEPELSQLATTAGLQPNPGLKCSGTVGRLVHTLTQVYMFHIHAHLFFIIVQLVH
jgi:hypothetical protein